jgi:hypothetical protein
LKIGNSHKYLHLIYIAYKNRERKKLFPSILSWDRMVMLT